jgi:xanthine dehydrogenase accessory factor
LRSPAKQVLMIASKRKAEKLRAVMRMRGIDESQLARLQAPAGPDAGAKTPGEIALVAIVGVLALLRGRSEVAEAKFVNPVCGMAVSIANPLHIEIYEGVSYYFCCDGCRTTFLKEPAKYAAIHHASVGRVPA